MKKTNVLTYLLISLSIFFLSDAQECAVQSGQTTAIQVRGQVQPQISCTDSTMILTPPDGCCPPDKPLYDATNRVCCSKENFNEDTKQCCGGCGHYNAAEKTCCSNAYNPTTKQCCPSKYPTFDPSNHKCCGKVSKRLPGGMTALVRVCV